MIDRVHDIRYSYLVGESNFNIDDIGMGRETMIAIGSHVTTQLGITVVR